MKDQQVMVRELYDHNNDPLETRNVAHEVANTEVIFQLADQLQEVINK